MRFSCDECGRSYVASDDVAGRAFRMRCKQCGSDIVVRPPLAAPTPFPPPPATGQEAPRREPRRSSFDPFEGDVLGDADVAVSDEALEILDRTPAPKLIPRPAAPPPDAAARPAPPPTPRPQVPRVRAGRMLPAEDEAMLGPPGAEDRRSLPRWAIALVVAAGALAAAGGFLFLR